MSPKLLRCPAIVALLACALSSAAYRCRGLYAAQAAPPARKESPAENREANANAAKPKLSWDGPEFRQMEKEWLDMTVPPDTSPKSKPYLRYRQLVELLNKKLPKKDIPDLIASLRTVPIDADKQTYFQKTLLDALATNLMESRDRENLVALFSTHFTNYISFGTTEWGLVCFGKKMKDPILVLGEAYRRSRDPTIRARISTAVHQSFDGNGVEGKDEGEFVKNAMKWYQDNKQRLILNIYHDEGDNILTWRECPLYYLAPDSKK